MFKKILLVSSIEGGLVMLAELCAAKLIIAPYFGTSIQVWAATLSVILGGLAAGYLIGSRRSKFVYERNIKDLKIIFLFKGIILCFVNPEIRILNHEMCLNQYYFNSNKNE